MAVDGVGLGRGLGWRAVGRGDTLPPPSSAVSFFFATWPFLAIRKTRVLPDTADDDGRNRAPPLKPLWFFEQETATELGLDFRFFAVSKSL